MAFNSAVALIDHVDRADQIEAKGAKCFVVDPRKFRIIKDSWNKTDRQDARNLAKALWVHVVTGEFGIPTVYKPTGVVRELRKLFAQYCLLNRQIATHKNNAQAIFVENGVELKKEAKSRLWVPESGLELLKEMNVSAASAVCLQLTLRVLWKVAEAKERLATEILLAGESLKSQVELLISIKGVTPLIALAFLSDVADIRRFRTLRKMNAYLGLVPRASNSGGKDRPGHITRESRKLTRTILTQCVHHVAASSVSLDRYYRELREKRGTGRARIAVIRKLCGMMRRMLLSGEQYRWMYQGLYDKKLRQYERVLKRVKEERQLDIVACSQRWTLLLGEYMNEQLLLRLPHHQFAFTIPKVLRAFFRHDKRLHGEISRLVYGLVQDFTSEAAGKSIRCAALVVFQSAGEFVRWNPTGMDCSSREASIAEGAIFSSATHAWAHRILAPHRDTTKFPNSSRRPSRPTVSATVRLSPRPSVRRGLRSWLWGASVLAIRPNGKL